MEEDNKYQHDEYAGRSASQLARELLKLLLVLLWRMLLWLIRKFLKGVLWCIQVTEKGWERLNIWWHDNDTQEKVAKIKAWLKMTVKTLGRWFIIAGKVTLKGIIIGAAATAHGIKVGAIATAKGTVIGVKATVQGIIHLKPTVKKIGQLMKLGWLATVSWLKKCRRGVRLSQIRRKRRYDEFRRKGGIKGMMIGTTKNIKSGIQLFMEEDQEEATPDAVTEDDIMEEALEKSANDGRKSAKIGKSVFSHVKSFMDVE